MELPKKDRRPIHHDVGRTGTAPRSVLVLDRILELGRHAAVPESMRIHNKRPWPTGTRRLGASRFQPIVLPNATLYIVCNTGIGPAGLGVAK